MSATLNRNQLIASAAGTLQVLEVLSDSNAPLALGDVASATGRPKGTVHRMLATLVNTGFVAHDPATGRYRPTLKLWRLGASAVRDLELTRLAVPALEKLVAEAGETVHLAVLDPSGGTVYVSKVESPQSIRVQTRLGQLNPAWCTATGRVLLAFHPELADRVLAGKLEARTPKTVTDPKRIRALLADVREKGYAVTRGENHPELAGIAAPVRDHTGGVIAACGLGIPAFRMDRALVDRSIPLVQRASLEISRQLGYLEAKNRHVR
ncbi:MAG TPA: IclR family transcriptional regulator [Usitatibacter sp.]|nr:IclR family transcriptional regulator [Usitatibacter sp.]